jgi:hypothetical protein
MVATLLVVSIGGIYFWLQGRIDELETNIAEEQDALREIYTSGAAFSVAREKFDASREQATKNATLNITTSVAELVEPMSFEAVDRNGPVGNKQLKEFVDFKGSTKDKPIGARKKKGKKESAAGYYQRDQELTFKEGIPLTTIYDLLEKIEESPDMLFVTDMRLERNRNDPERAGQGRIIVSTFYWQGEKKGE